MGRFSIRRPSVWGFASSNGRIADFSFFPFFFWGSIIQNHQTLSRFTFWVTIDARYCRLLASGPHRFHSCRIKTPEKKSCLFASSDSTKLFSFFVFLSYLKPTDPSRCPSAAFQLPRAIKYRSAAAFLFLPWKGQDVESLARLSEHRPRGWYSQCRCTRLNCWGHVSVSHESRWSGAMASAWLSDWVLRPGGRFQQRER